MRDNKYQAVSKKTTPIFFVGVTNENSVIANAIKSFLENECSRTVLFRHNQSLYDEDDLWSTYADIMSCERIVVFISKALDASSFCRMQLRQLRCVPNHLLSLFPILLDNTTVPEEISHQQVFNFIDVDSDLSRITTQLREWLDADDFDLFQSEQKTVNAKLTCVDLSERMESLKKVKVADNVLDLNEIDRWDRSGNRILAIEGGPSSGKTLMVERLLLERGSKIAAVHFITPKDPKDDLEANVCKAIQNVATQLSANLAQYRASLMESLERDLAQLDVNSQFNTLIIEPIQRENPNHNFWLIFDGIEELNDNYGQNILLGILVQNLNRFPKWIRFIVTYRPNSNIRLFLHGNAVFLHLSDSVEDMSDGYYLVDKHVSSLSEKKSEISLIGNEKSKRLPLFISYGHDAHTEKVIAIRDALLKRGHKVWIDRSGIPFGSDWRRKIYDGIQQSQLFLAFISEHSMKSEYCRTEIRIAIGVPEHLMPSLPLKLDDVEIPQLLGNKVVLDLCDWPSVGEIAKFNDAMDALTRWIDMDSHERFCKDMNYLNHRLEPFSFEARLGELINSLFVGRKWLLPILDEWDKSDARLFGLVGGPGFGKSIFAANLKALCPDKVMAALFIEWNMPSLFSTRRIIQSLAFQLAVRLEDYRVELIKQLQDISILSDLNDDDLFNTLLIVPLESVKNDETQWIILDALDEATGKDGGNPFVSTLIRNLDRFPQWVKFVVTTRPDANIIPLLERYHLQFFDTDDTTTKWQHDDMMEYILTTLKMLLPDFHDCNQNNIASELSDIGLTSELLESLIEKSQGMFLYLRIVCQDIIEGRIVADDIKNLPIGIDSVFLQFFTRQYSGSAYSVFEEKLRPLLEVGAACYEEITLELLQESVQANGIDMSLIQIEHTMQTLGTLVEIQTLKDGRHRFQFVHRYIWEWLSSLPDGATFRIDQLSGHRKLACFCQKKVSEFSKGQDQTPTSSYALIHIIKHLINIDNEKTIWSLLCAPSPRLIADQFFSFGNYSVARATVIDALLYYFTKLADAMGKYKHLLPKISRLLITFSTIGAKEKQELSKIFIPGLSLETLLSKLMSIRNLETFYIFSSYFLGRPSTPDWNHEIIIEAIERKCGVSLSKLEDEDIQFLVNGPLSDGIKWLSVFQIYRLLKVIRDKKCQDKIVESMLGHIHNFKIILVAWHLEALKAAEEGKLGDLATLEQDRKWIEKGGYIGDPVHELVMRAINLHVHGMTNEAKQWLAYADEILIKGKRTWVNKAVAEVYAHMGCLDEAINSINRQVEQIRIRYGENLDENDFLTLIKSNRLIPRPVTDFTYFYKHWEHYLKIFKETGNDKDTVEQNWYYNFVKQKSEINFDSAELGKICQDFFYESSLKKQPLVNTLSGRKENNANVTEITPSNVHELLMKELICATETMISPCPVCDNNATETIGYLKILIDSLIAMPVDCINKTILKKLFCVLIDNAMTNEIQRLLDGIALPQSVKMQCLLQAVDSILHQYANEPLAVKEHIVQMSIPIITTYWKSYDNHRIEDQETYALLALLHVINQYDDSLILKNTADEIFLLLDIVFQATPLCDFCTDCAGENFMYECAGLFMDSSILTAEQFAQWYKRYCEAIDGEINLTMLMPDSDDWVYPEDRRPDIFLEFLRKSKRYLDNSFSIIRKQISSLHDEDRQKELSIELVKVSIEKSNILEAKKTINSIDSATLIEYSDSFEELDLEVLYYSLISSNVDDFTITQVISNLSWKKMSFSRLGLLIRHLIDINDFIKYWFYEMIRTIDIREDEDILASLIKLCPELKLQLNP